MTKKIHTPALSVPRNAPPRVKNAELKKTAWYTTTMSAASARTPSKHGNRLCGRAGCTTASSRAIDATLTRSGRYSKQPVITHHLVSPP